MYRFLPPLFLLYFAVPLGACSCGETFSYAPIVASPTAVFDKFDPSAKTIETAEVAVSEESAENRENVQKVEKPAIPKSIYPKDSGIDSSVKTPSDETKGQKTFASLLIYELPISLMKKESEGETQIVGKPPGVVPNDDSTKEQWKEEKAEVKSEETHPPEPRINEEEKEKNKENNVALGQTGYRAGESVIQEKPDLPEGPSDVNMPENLTKPSEPDDETTDDTTKPDDSHKKENQRESVSSSVSAPPSNTSGDGNSGNGRTGGGIDESQSWTITVLFMLAALSTVAFLVMVFVVGDYRRRWLNAIMSQSGRMPGFRGGMYDIPGVSVGYGRYED